VISPEKDQHQNEAEAPAEATPIDNEASQAANEDAEAVNGTAEDGGQIESEAETEAETEATSEEQTPEQMAAEIEGLKAVVTRQQEDVLRAQAEVDNIRKRAQREVENAHKFGLEKMMNELLPVRDSLELGLGAAGDEGVEVASVREGLELTLKMFNTATEKFGLLEVDPLDEAFDPDKHQAISMQEVEGKASGTVINVVQKGFVLNERLVRPAMVIVAK